MQINNRLLTPLVTIAILALGFFQTANSDGEFTTLEKFQLLALFVGAVVTYIAPITKGKWPGILKVAGAVLGAALATIVTAIGEGTIIDTNLLTLVILAALNAFAAQTGTDARVDATKAAISDPDQSTKTAIEIDPAAAAVALAQLEKSGTSPGHTLR